VARVELTASDVREYARLVAPDDATQQDRIVERLTTAAERGERALADTRIARGPEGGMAAAVVLFPGPGGVARLGVPRPATANADEAAATLVPEILTRARAKGITGIWSRPAVGAVGPRFRGALAEAGFRDLGERLEFQAQVADLPLDDDSPLAWRTMGETGEDAAVTMLARVAEGDPHGEEEHEQPRQALRRTLGAPALTSGPESVCIGYERDRAIAFVCAQVARSDGWSRIAYMGLVPEARGRRLGRWVHRRGFRMLRDQGGKLYHGGTAADNAAMVRLFRSHGCREFARMHQFEWTECPPATPHAGYDRHP